MSTFSAGAITGTLGLDTSEYSEAMRESTSIAGIFAEEIGHILAEATGSPLLGELANGISEVVAAASSGDWGESFAASIHTASAAASGFLELLKGQAEQMHEAGLAAEKFGVSVEFISSVGAAAKNSGMDIDSLGMSLKFMLDKAANAVDGNKEAVKAFGELGISMNDVSRLASDPEQMFYRVADAIASIEEPQKRVQAAGDLLGQRMGPNLIPFLKQGSDGIKDFANQITAMGGTYSEQDAEMGRQIGQLEILFTAALNGMEKAAAKPIFAYLIDHSKELTEDMKMLADWVGREIPVAFDKAAKAFEQMKPMLDELRDDLGKFTDTTSSGNSTAVDEMHQEIREDLGSVMGDLFLKATTNEKIPWSRIFSDFVNPNDDGTYDFQIGGTRAVLTGNKPQSTQAPAVNVGPVNITIDPAKAAQQTAAALTPVIKKAARQHAAHGTKLQSILDSFQGN